MTAETKISPAFEQTLAESGPNERSEAIVIYQAPISEDLGLGGRPHEIETRRELVKDRSDIQKPVEERIVEDYQAVASGRVRRGGRLAASSIGSGTLPVVRVEVTRRTLSALAAQPEVVAVMPNQKVQLIEPTLVDYADLAKREVNDGLPWGLKRLGIPELWETTRGEGINIAVLDTGVYSEHPALNGRVKDFVIIDPLGRRIAADPTFDGGRHGTHVCGTIAGGKTPEGVSIGVAPEASLLAAGVLVGDATLHTLMEGISWAVESGAHIINMSLSFSYYEPLFAQVFDILINQYGILPVASIGNDSHGNCGSPGNAHSVLSVGAVEPLTRNRVAVPFFSSGASLVFPGQEPNALVTKPDVVAPGAQVYSCVPPETRSDGTRWYSYMSGTSMAAPHVAGVAALLMAAKPEARVIDVMRVLKETAWHPDGAERRPDNRWGYGLIQPKDALKALG